MPRTPDFSVHALGRCLERHGFLPTPEGCAQVMDDLLKGRAVLLRRQTDRPEGKDGDVYLVNLQGHAVQVVFSPHTRQVVTVLPPPGTGKKFHILPYRQPEGWIFHRGKRRPARRRQPA